MAEKWAFNRFKYYIPKIIWGIILVLIAAFIIRVVVWENSYYSSKEGSERAVAVDAEANPEVDESEVTEYDINSYTVPATNPRFISIDAINVPKSRILSVGINNKGELATPVGIFDAGWFNESGKPGQGGTLLLDGHNGGPTKTGIFKHLPLLCVDGDTSTRTAEKSSRTCSGTGDVITIERGDGTIFKYRAVENVTIPLSEADAYMSTATVSPKKGVESLSIITCTGEWSQAQRTYLSRQFTRAVLISE